MENYSEQKIIVAAAVVMLAAFASGSTLATFNDTELTKNTFKAGQVDLQIAWESTYNGQVIGSSGFTNETPIFNLYDIKPGDNGTAKISLKIYDNPSTLYVQFNKTDDRDRTCIEPEQAVETNCAPMNNGELDENLVKTAWIDDGDGIKEENETEISLNESWTPVKTSGGLLKVFGSETKYLMLEWNLPHNVSNEVQTDTLEYTLAFKAQQARHMNNTEDFEEGDTGDEDNNTTEPGDGSNGDNTTTDPDDGNQTANETDDGSTNVDNPPVADFSYSPTSPVTGEDIQFNGSDSSDDNQIVLYEWDWNSDGVYEASVKNPIHSYSTDGDKNVTLKVTDNSSQTDTESKLIPVASSTDGDSDEDESDGDTDSGSSGGSISTTGGGGSSTGDSGTVRFNLTEGQTTLEGITVTANDTNSRSDTSDSTGIAIISLPAGNYEFTFEGDGFETKTETYEVREGSTRTFQVEMTSTTDSVNINLSDLLVSIVDRNLTAIEDANVELNNSDTETTDSLGLARFTVTPGAYSIQVSASGYQNGSDTVNIETGEDETVEIQLDPVELEEEGETVEGNTTDDGAPATGSFLSSSTGGAAAAGFFLLLLIILAYFAYKKYYAA